MSGPVIPPTITAEDKDELVRRALRFGAAHALLHEELRREPFHEKADDWDARQHVAFDAQQDEQKKLEAWAHSLYAKSVPRPPEAVQPTNGTPEEVLF